MRSLTFRLWAGVALCVTASACATSHAAYDGTALQTIETPASAKNPVLPAFEIVAFDVLLNLAGRQLYADTKDFDVTVRSIKQNLRGRWVIDDDPFQVNQFGHPYQGSMYHMFARSAGMNYWQSTAYTFAGSALWEIAGETTKPSINDQIASGIAGSFLGEPLFRMAHLLLEKGHGHVGTRRALLAGALSPAVGFNRLMFGNRFDDIFPSHDPAFDVRMQFGASGTSNSRPGPTLSVMKNDTVLDLSMEYGLPGKPGYTYSRPFDYFSLQAIGSRASGLESFMTRGLIAGKSYDAGPGGRGVWGLYGVYDYHSPEIFRVSTTAASLGTSVQFGLPSALTFQGTVLGGIGYAAAHPLHETVDRDYHYGLAPQATASIRLVAGNRVSFDLGARQYYVSDVGAFDTSGNDVILRTDASIGVRLFKRQAVSLRYLLFRREATYGALPKQSQERGTFAIFYTLLGPQHFGAVDWDR